VLAFFTESQYIYLVSTEEFNIRRLSFRPDFSGSKSFLFRHDLKPCFSIKGYLTSNKLLEVIVMLTQNSVELLRKHLIASVEQMKEEQLLKVYQFTAQLLGEELSEMITEEWISGQVNREKLVEAIRDHREKYPYSRQ
jgi:hypothetical protein